jgi:aldose 1-epimerase
LSDASLRIERRGRAAAIVLSAGRLEATFVPELNMLGASLRLAGEEFLATPGGLAAYGKGHTTGLPLLAPWANRLSGLGYRSGRVRVDLAGLPLHVDGNGLPIHGTMSARQAWKVEELSSRRGVARVAASFAYETQDLLAAFPFPHRLEVAASVDGKALTVTTVLRPTGSRPVPVSFGHHPYFRLPEGSRSAWHLRLPRREQLELDERGIPTGGRTRCPAEVEPIRNRVFDDLFEVGARRTLGLELGHRRLSVELEDGYCFAQVFAPPGRRFVALEPMTAPTNALVEGTCPTVRPGETFVARFRLRPET